VHSLVKDLMTTQVVTAGPATSFKELVARLATHRVSAVPVVDEDRRVLGIVSEADLLLKEEFPDPDQNIPLFWTRRRRLERAKAAGATARDLMTAAVASIFPEATVPEAARRMHTAGVKRLPVVDGDGRLVGIVSRADPPKVFLRADADIVGVALTFLHALFFSVLRLALPHPVGGDPGPRLLEHPRDRRLLPRRTRQRILVAHPALGR